MNYIIAFLPWLLWLASLVGSYYILRFLRKSIQSRSILFALGLFLIFFTTFLVIPLLFFWSFSIKPTLRWQQKANTNNAAIIFGFGYEKDKDGKMLAGTANQFLFDWCVNHSSTDTFILQKAVRVAAEQAIEKNDLQKPVVLIDMHDENEGNYVNTLEAAKGALAQMQKNKISGVLVLAHYAQMPRVIFDLNHLVSKYNIEENVEFIIPDITYTPYPKRSVQLWTRCDFLYKLTELYYSRPRDAFSCLLM